MLVSEIMTKDVITVTPDTSLKKAGEIFKEKRISGLPVVDERGNIVGVITLTDLMRILGNIYKWKELEKESPDMRLSSMYEMEKQNARVKDCMAKNVIALMENETIEDAARKMFHNGVHTLPVVKDNKVIGVVGKRDLIYACF